MKRFHTILINIPADSFRQIVTNWLSNPQENRKDSEESKTKQTNKKQTGQVLGQQLRYLCPAIRTPGIIICLNSTPLLASAHDGGSKELAAMAWRTGLLPPAREIRITELSDPAGPGETCLLNSTLIEWTTEWKLFLSNNFFKYKKQY